jgi:apolipoprotein D and lipocalin family protein
LPLNHLIKINIWVNGMKLPV